MVRLHLLIQGRVQGVGFRPCAYRLASQMGLTGWVKNTPAGVSIEVQGSQALQFTTQLKLNLPPLARVDHLIVQQVDCIQDDSVFEIRDSMPGQANTIIAPDTSVCRDCLGELFNPASRYYRYPFLNCTQCGPRLTITTVLPYDRRQTAMRDFPLCAACQYDYDNPLNRRYHAQPTACPACGPTLSTSIDRIAEKIRQGEIVALKGLGGYQLICDAMNETAVLKLRQLKNRAAKPFSLMLTNVASAEMIGHISLAEAALLTSSARPIVLLKKKIGERCLEKSPLTPLFQRGEKDLDCSPRGEKDLDCSPRGEKDLDCSPRGEKGSCLLQRESNVFPPLEKGGQGGFLDHEKYNHLAPGLTHLGIMLPDTPLHYLLLNALCGSSDGTAWLENQQSVMLVVTSANCGGDPLIHEDDVAAQVLQDIADCIVSHNRPIMTRADDSVTRIIGDVPMFIRRARGFVPIPIPLPYEIPPTLALGSQLKNTFCITRGKEAFVSQHIGNLNNPATIAFLHESLRYFLKFLDVTPECVAYDRHPDCYTRLLVENWDIEHVAIQHHHAHMASIAAEHGIVKPVFGLVLDGYGYGDDGGAWGGELFWMDHTQCKRLGSFSPLPQPGGDIAAREPWRMAAAVLHELGQTDAITARFGLFPHAQGVRQLLEDNLHCSPTSSCGRLFDAASALLGIQTMSDYEGHAAMRLESVVTAPQGVANGWRIDDNSFNMMPTLAVLADIQDPVLGANMFHGTLIAGLTAWIKANMQEKKLDTVLLGGGCFMNKVLSEGLVTALAQAGIQALLPRVLPPNDGGLSLGQAWLAGQKRMTTCV